MSLVANAPQNTTSTTPNVDASSTSTRVSAEIPLASTSTSSNAVATVEPHVADMPNATTAQTTTSNSAINVARADDAVVNQLNVDEWNWRGWQKYCDRQQSLARPLAQGLSRDVVHLYLLPAAAEREVNDLRTNERLYEFVSTLLRPSSQEVMAELKRIVNNYRELDSFSEHDTLWVQVKQYNQRWQEEARLFELETRCTTHDTDALALLGNSTTCGETAQSDFRRSTKMRTDVPKGSVLHLYIEGLQQIDRGLAAFVKIQQPTDSQAAQAHAIQYALDNTPQHESRMTIASDKESLSFTESELEEMRHRYGKTNTRNVLDDGSLLIPSCVQTGMGRVLSFLRYDNPYFQVMLFAIFFVAVGIAATACVTMNNRLLRLSLMGLSWLLSLLYLKSK